MILKRPRGAEAESPASLRARLERTWEARLARAISSQADTLDEPEFPLTVSIGRPALTGDALVRNRGEIQEWITQWRSLDASAPVAFETATKRRVGEVTLPVHICFETVDILAAFLGPRHERELSVARKTAKVLTGIDERLAAMAPHWRRVAELPDAERQGFAELIRARREGRGDLGDIRELAIAGLDSKWVEKRQAMVREALRHIDCLQEGSTFREEFGFKEEDRQEIWMKFHPDDVLMPLGDQEIAMRPSKIRTLPASIRRAVIVENKATFSGHDPLPGVCLFFGSGNAISGTAHSMPFLKDLEVIYWGDLDSFGMKILSRVRSVLPQARSFAMDDCTMSAHRHLWTHEPESDRFTGCISHLVPAEERALAFIRGGHWRLEQERLGMRPDQIAEIGLMRAS